MTTQTPTATIPRCPRCGKQRILYGGVCSRCLDAEEREDREERRGMPYAALNLLTRAGIPMHAPAGGAL